MKPEALLLNFSRHLRKLRLEKQMSQEKLALAAGMRQTHLSRLEAAGREPRLSTLLSLSRGLGISMNELIPGNLLEGNGTEASVSETTVSSEESESPHA